MFQDKKTCQKIQAGEDELGPRVHWNITEGKLMDRRRLRYVGKFALT